MDLENIREFLCTVRGAYTAGAVGAVVAVATGYLTGRLSSKNRKEAIVAEQNYKLENKRLDLEQSKVEVEKLRASGDPVKLRELEYVHKANERADQMKSSELERNAVNDDAERLRKNRLEDFDRVRRFQVEDENRKEGYARAAREDTLTLSRELSVALNPVIESYAQAIRNYSSNGSNVEDPDEKIRAEYRTGVVEALLEKLGESYGNDEEEYDVTDEDQERIDRIVNAKYPLPKAHIKPQMPAELSSLLSLIPKSN
ncbi:MAG: hypothetical protein AABW71_03950 [Nanoarchaeota archaeon]